jgi:hypothetical protein
MIRVVLSRIRIQGSIDPDPQHCNFLGRHPNVINRSTELCTKKRAVVDIRPVVNHIRLCPAGRGRADPAGIHRLVMRSAAFFRGRRVLHGGRLKKT